MRHGARAHGGEKRTHQLNARSPIDTAGVPAMETHISPRRRGHAHSHSALASTPFLYGSCVEDKVLKKKIGPLAGQKVALIFFDATQPILVDFEAHAGELNCIQFKCVDEFSE